MLYNNNRFNNRIWTHESVYGDSPIGNLEGITVSSIPPFQQGFDCDILARIPVGVHDNSTFLAFKEGIICTTVSLPNSTAVGTELRGMPRIDDIQRNVLVKAPLNEILLEGKEGNTHNLTIEPFSFWTEPLEVLNGNISIVSQSHFSNVPYNFPYSVLDKVVFVSFSSIQCLLSIGTSSIGIGTKSALPFKQFLPSMPNVLSKIILMQNLPLLGRDYRNRKAFAVYINSQNILALRGCNILLGEICDNFQFGGQTIGLASPSSFEKVIISLKIPILLYRDSNSMSWINSQFDERNGFGKGLGVAWDIEFDSNSFRFSLASPNGTFKTCKNLDIESSPCFRICKCLSMKIHESIAEVSFFPEPIELGSSLQREIFEDFTLFDSNILNLQKNSTLHTNQIYMLRNIYNTTRQFIPPLKGAGFLVEFR